MIRQFPAVPHDAVNEFYNLKGNFNLDYLRSAKTTDIATAVDNDDDSVNSGMPGLQTRHCEETSSDDDSNFDKKPTKASTTVQWKVLIDDSDGEKFTCRHVRAQRTKRNAKCQHNCRKKDALRKERIKNTPFAEDVDEPFVSFIENVVSDNFFATIENNKVEFFPTDPHPFRTRQNH
jgi:hypothetical protein